ncbi:MAG: glycosyltransferase family 4 protein [Spirochaetota bacterium]|nr:glycosyltransferase family 4 protein [Spirochaetota bacterium]
MKILQVNSFYYNRGGDCTHMFATTKLLEQHEHIVIPFSMNHPLNFDSPYSKYWPSYIDFVEALKEKSIKNATNVITRTIYSFEAKECIGKILDDEKPDIVHIHNILHHITPSILGEIKKRKIPIVWTLHDFTIICPNTSFLTERGDICESCKRRKFFMAPLKRCKKNSLAASSVAMLENYTHRFINIYRHVDKFISPSNFLRHKFIEYGMGKKIITLNNFININSIKPNYNNLSYYLYIGRLNHIKGINLLVTAAKKNPYIQLKVVGDGELFEEYNSENIANIEFLGFKTGQELQNIISNAMFIVVPSQWYENFPYSILEAFANGKPVIASRIGGIPELVKDHETGLTFEHNNPDELSTKIACLVNNPVKIDEMGKNARTFIELKLNADTHYLKLMEIYKSVL